MTDDIRLLVLVENRAPADSNLESEHGFAVLVTADGGMGLLDTGQSGLVVRNAGRLGVSLQDLDWIALSHGHYDHTGGLPAVLERARRPRVVMHPAAFEDKCAQRDDGRVESIGMPLTRPQLAEQTRLAETRQALALSASVRFIGEVPRRTTFETVPPRFAIRCGNACEPDDFADDTGMLLRTARGSVVLAGCAHCGIVNLLYRVRELTDGATIHAVVGGIHLRNASPRRVEQTIRACREFDVQRFGLCHCTGDDAIRAFEHAFPGRCMLCQTGTVLAFPAASGPAAR